MVVPPPLRTPAGLGMGRALPERWLRPLHAWVQIETRPRDRRAASLKWGGGAQGGCRACWPRIVPPPSHPSPRHVVSPAPCGPSPPVLGRLRWGHPEFGTGCPPTPPPTGGCCGCCTEDRKRGCRVLHIFLGGLFLFKAAPGAATPLPAQTTGASGARRGAFRGALRGGAPSGPVGCPHPWYTLLFVTFWGGAITPWGSVPSGAACSCRWLCLRGGGRWGEQGRAPPALVPKTRPPGGLAQPGDLLRTPRGSLGCPPHPWRCMG